MFELEPKEEKDQNGAAREESVSMHALKTVMIIAGEASGDMHGARLVKAMHALRPNLRFLGIGGSDLKKAGVEIRVDNAQIAVVGVSEAIVKLRILSQALRIAKSDLQNRRPELLIVIDFPDFNLHVATRAKRLGIPVLYYISPQIWAWRTGRVRKIKRVVDHMVVIFPFEADFYRAWGVPVSFVGHPLLDREDGVGEGDPEGGLKGDKDLVVGLLPGSRNEEIARLFPMMVDVAETLTEAFPDAVFPVPVASSVDRKLVESMVHQRRARFLLLSGRLQDVFDKAALLITASGTVTLEAALAGTPMIIVYKVSPLSYWLGKQLIRVKYIGLANLVAGKRIVPELIQHEASSEKVAGLATSLLRDRDALERMRQDLAQVAQRLGSPGASMRAARVALSLLEQDGLGIP